MYYQKDEEVRRRINLFLQTAFDLPEEDYYARLNVKNLLTLKSALSDINNVLTMRLTLEFLNWAAQALPLDEIAIGQIRNDVLATKPNSNGYDIHCTAPISFVAEVKCNIPVNGGRKYGAAQRNGIVKDIDALLHGKSKVSSIDSKCLKFMVFIDLPEVRAANEHLLVTNSRLLSAFRFIKENEAPNDPTVVYGVYVALHS